VCFLTVCECAACERVGCACGWVEWAYGAGVCEWGNVRKACVRGVRGRV
jgi:hypothetical protein